MTEVTSTHTGWSRALRHTIHDRLIRTEDYVNHRVPSAMREHVHQCLARIQEYASQQPFTRHVRKGHECIALTDEYDKIVDSVTASHLRRSLRLTTPNRNKIVSSLLSILPELGPATLFRCDIAKFFDTVDRDAVLRKVRDETTIGRIADQVLLQYATTCQRAGLTGLARGLALSSTLSEWLLAKLDVLMKSQQGIYFYARFVDDIIVIAASDCAEPDPVTTIESFLKKHIPGTLTLNSQKTTRVVISKSPNEPSLDRAFSFLGYVFSGRSPQGAISVDISPSKAKRIRSKLMISFRKYCDTRDFAELYLALRFLSSNTALVRRGVMSRAMRTGIYYNYPAITSDTYRNGNLSALDRFTRSVIFASRTLISNTTRVALSVDEKRRLLRCSFVAGHRQKVFCQISRDRALKLVEGWNHGS